MVNVTKAARYLYRSETIIIATSCRTTI